jgi:hypothetical protein
MTVTESARAGASSSIANPLASTTALREAAVDHFKRPAPAAGETMFRCQNSNMPFGADADNDDTQPQASPQCHWLQLRQRTSLSGCPLKRSVVTFGLSNATATHSLGHLGALRILFSRGPV